MDPVTHQERRRAPRLQTNIPTLLEVLRQQPVRLHPKLEAVYERVVSNEERAGQKHPGVVKDLSTNGAFITGPPLPLLSRVAFTFHLDGFGQVEALGWTLWRRTAECVIPSPNGSEVKLAAGFGVLFEAVSLEARQVIANMVVGPPPMAS